MQNSEREQFDQSWKAAFDGAEMEPSGRLWNSIEGSLAGNEAATMKRRVVFYQRLAAATVLFALLSGAYAVYVYNGRTDEIASLQQPQSSAQRNAQSPSDNTTSAPTDNSVASSSPSSGQVSEPTTIRPSDGGRELTEMHNPPAVIGSDESESLEEPRIAVHDKDVTLPEQVVSSEPEIPTIAENTTNDSDEKKEEQQQVVLLSADEINALAEAEEKKKEDKTKSDRALWLGLGGAAGSYAPNAVVTGGSLMQADQAPTSFSQSQNIPMSYSDNVGSAYSAGVSAGFRIAKRWVLQSGLSYINQRIDYTTNFVGVTSANKATAMTREYFAETSYDLAVTNPYEVSSATEMLSIPVQAGFLIVDRKFGWQLNTGVSTDLLLKNSLTDKSGLRDKVSEGAGEDSPYRSVNGAALLNTELSYKIGDHYRLAIVPGMRYYFKPMLKGENVEGTPLVLDVGFRFNYLFK